MNDIIDWKLSIQLAGNNIDHAKEFLQLLADELTKQLNIIRCHVNSDHKKLNNELHKLLGGLSYCGALRLKNATKAFYDAVKNDIDIAIVNLQFETEANLFIEYVNNKLND